MEPAEKMAEFLPSFDKTSARTSRTQYYLYIEMLQPWQTVCQIENPLLGNLAALVQHQSFQTPVAGAQRHESAVCDPPTQAQVQFVQLQEVKGHFESDVRYF